MDKRFLGIITALIIVFVAIFAFTKNSGNGSSSGNSANKSQPTNHLEGQGKSNVTLVEYGDFQCPVCSTYYQPLKQVTTQMSEQIYFQFRNLPLTSIHPNAFAAARAAEAAGMQNKYWEMNGTLYENQSEWSSSQTPQSVFTDYAKKLGLDLNKFKQDYASSRVNDAINADLAAFDKTGQQVATPTFFLNGRYVPLSQVSDPKTNIPSVDKFVSLINAEIAKKASAKQ